MAAAPVGPRDHTPLARVPGHITPNQEGRSSLYSLARVRRNLYLTQPGKAAGAKGRERSGCDQGTPYRNPALAKRRCVALFARP